MTIPRPTLFDTALAQALNAHGITRTGLCKVGGKHLSEAPNEPPPANPPEFIVGGMVWTQDSMLSANAADQQFCEWLRSAKPGDVWDGMHTERCECIAPLEIAEDAAVEVDRAYAADKASGTLERRREERALREQMRMADVMGNRR